ncbi:MAG: M56 family metallopeptidase [Acidobacteriota bacterium]|jgi:TonB family protein
MTAPTFLSLLLTNAAVAAALALAVVALTRRWVHPGVVRAAWLVVLLRLVVPPGVAVPLVEKPVRRAAPGVVAVDARLAGPAPAGATSAARFNPWGLAWGCGTLGLLGLWGWRGLGLWRAARRGRLPEAELAARLARCAERLGVRPPQLRLVEAAVPPAVLTLPGRAVLLLPAHLPAMLTPDELDALLAHELTHLQRRDHWARWLEAAALLLHWWHPVGWWAVRRARRAEEQGCDAAVRRAFPHLARPLARCLVQVARSAPAIPTPLVSAFADLAQLERRVHMLTTNEKQQPPRRWQRAAIAALATTLVLTPVLRAAPQWPREAEVPLTLQLTDASLADVLTTLAGVSGLRIEVDARLLARPVSVAVTDAPLHEVVRLVAEAAKAELLWRDGAALLVPRSEAAAEPPLPPSAPSPRVPPYRLGPHLGITEPRKINSVPPVYPLEARRERVVGVVILDVIIDEQGRPADIKVLRGLPFGLTEAAVEAVRQWRWEPATMEGQPVPVILTVTIRFSLDSESPTPPPAR